MRRAQACTLFGTVCLAGTFDLRVRRQRFLHQASQLLLVSGVLFHRFDDDAVNRAIRCLLRWRADGRGASAEAEWWWFLSWRHKRSTQTLSRDNRLIG